jgi:5'-3' exonuclease
MITKKDFENEYKIIPEQWIDVGTLMGDNGDNIFGIPSWGEKTALEEIQEKDTYENVLGNYVAKYGELEKEFKNIESESDLAQLIAVETKSKKKKYSDLYLGMPFGGVALAIEQKKIKPIPQKALSLLMYQERLDLAHDLKKSHDEIENLPTYPIGEQSINIDGLREYFNKYSINLSILEELNNTSDRKEEKVEIMNDVGEKEEEANLFLF